MLLLLKLSHPLTQSRGCLEEILLATLRPVMALCVEREHLTGWHFGQEVRANDHPSVVLVAPFHVLRFGAQ